MHDDEVNYYNNECMLMMDDWRFGEWDYDMMRMDDDYNDAESTGGGR